MRMQMTPVAFATHSRLLPVIPQSPGAAFGHLRVFSHGRDNDSEEGERPLHRGSSATHYGVIVLSSRFINAMPNASRIYSSSPGLYEHTIVVRQSPLRLQPRINSTPTQTNTGLSTTEYPTATPPSSLSLPFVLNNVPAPLFTLVFSSSNNTTP
jgi:hypothetical protein